MEEWKPVCITTRPSPIDTGPRSGRTASQMIGVRAHDRPSVQTRGINLKNVAKHWTRLNPHRPYHRQRRNKTAFPSTRSICASPTMITPRNKVLEAAVTVASARRMTDLHARNFDSKTRTKRNKRVRRRRGCAIPARRAGYPQE